MIDAVPEHTPRDPGLQAERTALAWSRTGLAIAVNAILVLRSGLVAEQPALAAAGVVLFAISAAATGYGVIRRRELAAEHGPVMPSAWPLLAVAATVVLAAVAGVGSLLVEVT
ncbi:DUF202 domain-containing protein [Agromyces salentinus]|uniref:DUF202 domain-containing protein n=1 Tax=Agromyces salentinus TaxID=269421 RepID=A0ABN2MTP1_9MICO|nr:DUF202 domain-containing protein [Agromyces salentinus]